MVSIMQPTSPIVTMSLSILYWNCTGKALCVLFLTLSLALIQCYVHLYAGVHSFPFSVHCRYSIWKMLYGICTNEIIKKRRTEACDIDPLEREARNEGDAMHILYHVVICNSSHVYIHDRYWCTHTMLLLTGSFNV